MRRRAVLFDVGGPIDMELAWEMAVDGAIAAACGMQGIRVEPRMVEEASDAAVAALAPDVYDAMIDSLCGGDPETAARVLRAHGVPVSSSCESGTCGSCRTTLLDGQADHRDLVLLDEEKATQVMPCVSRARSGSLVLDL